MSLTGGQQIELEQAVRRWMESKGTSTCPICGQDAWSLGELALVFTMSVSTARNVAARPAQPRTHDDEHRGLRELRRVFGNIAGALSDAPRYQLVQLPCDNCGHVLFLNHAKVREVASSED